MSHHNPFTTPPPARRAAINPFTDEQTQKSSPLADATIDVGPASVIPNVRQDIRNPTPRPSFNSWNPFAEEEQPAEAAPIHPMDELKESIAKIFTSVERHFNVFKAKPNSSTAKQLKESIAMRYFLAYGFSAQAMQDEVRIEELIDQLIIAVKTLPITQEMIATSFQQAQELQQLLHQQHRSVESRDGVILDRYRDIYSHPTAQIKLTAGDYINASYIRMENLGGALHDLGVDEYLLSTINWDQLQQRDYIATQGPLDQTVADFWQMVEQYSVTDIVMLTDLTGIQADRNGTEREVNKCAHYWAGEGAQIHNPENSNQTVNHHWFRAWPDHGAPESKEPFLALINQVAEQRTDAPVIVHCSAGVGRTGTFILVDIMQRIIRALKPNESLAAIEKLQLATGVLKYLRTCRTFMVQNEEQWQFALACIEATPAANLHQETAI